ncbi:hypothetical protein J7E50_10965 [Pedobacter sp. ISL-68]|uniref:hypothetical protein n=1 Tax=unclassified Pedobacter TaxID=2628915 RepID=UPI001BE95A03|nr:MULTISPECIES: hypothetical protein [unclassified Pedobacter]MBT2561353.1 hypothetical protein [Pedobacter sp. ISL-64]MBT2590742.1 hypothetical protein [Pedobacter sp. ISL-68]
MADITMVAGKPISQFYKLPFEKNSRILRLNVLESHTEMRAGNRPFYRVERKPVSFKKGVLTIRVKLENEHPVKVYLKVEYDHLLVSCSVDTDECYLGRYAYRTLRAMLWNEFHDFEKYYWPECFNEITGRSKYLDVICDRYGIDIKLKKIFNGFFRPNDYFLPMTERKVLKREVGKKEPIILNNENAVGYCLANTDPVRFHSNHYPFLLPYTFSANADNKTVKSYKGFIFEDSDTEGFDFTPNQADLNKICYEMKNIARIQFTEYADNEELSDEINDLNLNNRDKIFELFNKALPMLSREPFSHYLFTYGMRNIQKRPMKKDMQVATFSMEVPTLSFLLTDKGDHYELKLRFRVNGKVLLFCEDRIAMFFICSASKPNVWYFLESETDSRVVLFFSRKNFRIQVPKGYYKEHFEHYVNEIKEYYELEVK